MKYRAIPIVLSVIIVLSMAIVACGGTPTFELSNLQITKDPLYVNEVQTISVDVRNTGGAGGTCTVNFSVGSEEFTREVMVDPGEKETASITPTFQSAGDYTVTVDSLSDSFTVIERVACATGAPVDSDDDWWWYDYVVTDGNVVVTYCMYDATVSTIDCVAEQALPAGETKKCTVEFPSTEMRIGFSKELTENVSRQVKIDGESFVSALWQVLFAANWTDITLKLGEREGGQFSYLDATGTLYVAGGAGDVDVVVTDENKEDREYTLSGGHEAGDMIGDFPLYAQAQAQGQDILINMPTKMTTGHAYNDVIKTGCKKECAVNGHDAEIDGAKFCEGDGTQVAPYVGTNGTLAIVATALNQRFIGIDLDFQMVLTVDIAPK